jgi:hypothetical protein
MDASRETAAVAVYEALLAMYGADWIIEQMGDELQGELAILGLIDDDSESGNDASNETSGTDSEESHADSEDSGPLVPDAGQPMDEE